MVQVPDGVRSRIVAQVQDGVRSRIVASPLATGAFAPGQVVVVNECLVLVRITRGSHPGFRRS